MCAAPGQGSADNLNNNNSIKLDLCSRMVQFGRPRAIFDRVIGPFAMPKHGVGGHSKSSELV